MRFFCEILGTRRIEGWRGERLGLMLVVIGGCCGFGLVKDPEEIQFEYLYVGKKVCLAGARN